MLLVALLKVEALLGQQIELVPGVGMVAVAPRLAENLREAREVLRPELLLGFVGFQGPEAVDVFNGAERLLPHLKLACHIKLLKASLKALVEGLGVREVGPVTVIPAIAVVPVPACSTQCSAMVWTLFVGSGI
jgi:hypothetical protein